MRLVCLKVCAKFAGEDGKPPELKVIKLRRRSVVFSPLPAGAELRLEASGQDVDLSRIVSSLLAGRSNVPRLLVGRRERRAGTYEELAGAAEGGRCGRGGAREAAEAAPGGAAAGGLLLQRDEVRGLRGERAERTSTHVRVDL
eukprot:768796-Hanusia_phi.AAC.8